MIDDNIVSKALGEMDFLKDHLVDIGNGLELTNYEIDVLKRNDISYLDCTSLKEILFRIENVIDDVDDYDENSYIKDDLNEMGITSGKFWIYSKDSSDTLYYTQGVPAGKEMWNTRNYLLSKKTKEIIKKGAKNINENIIASIKS